MTPPLLNLVGPGRLGRSLARLWHDAGLVRIQDIVGREHQRTLDAEAFIGGGRGCALARMRPADLTLIATPDDVLPAIAVELAARHHLGAGTVVFHCSGALGSDALSALRPGGAAIASIHPLKSFAVPEDVIRNFGGTVCTQEGDPAALAIVGPLFDGIGARRLTIDPAHKLSYHAGAVLACNHLVALMEAALLCMEAAGLAREAAWPALLPLIQGTLGNIDRAGTAAALTGPVARGDHATVLAEMAALAGFDQDIGAAYALLSKLSLRLAPASVQDSPFAHRLKQAIDDRYRGSTAPESPQ